MPAFPQFPELVSTVKTITTPPSLISSEVLLSLFMALGNRLIYCLAISMTDHLTQSFNGKSDGGLVFPVVCWTMLYFFGCLTWGLSFYVLPSSLCPTFLCTNPSIDDLSISSLLKLLKWPVLCTIGVEVFVFYLAGWCRRFPNEKGAAVGRFLSRHVPRVVLERLDRLQGESATTIVISQPYADDEPTTNESEKHIITYEPTLQHGLMSF